MNDAYRKTGSVVRWENGTLVRVNESGLAVVDGDLFRCLPYESWTAHPVVDESWVLTKADEIRNAVQSPVKIERLLISHGIAEHVCERRTWRDETRRVHVALTRDRVRALIDLDASTDDIARVAGALARCDGVERDPPPRLCLAPNVSAALIPSLIGLAPPNIELWQTARGVDGRGNPIVEARGEWPNWYRPSYRVRPARMPFNVRVECDVTEIESDRPVAVALLAPLDGLTMRVLIDDGRLAYPATVRVTRIDAVARERTWYPYGAGSFGAEMML